MAKGPYKKKKKRKESTHHIDLHLRGIVCVCVFMFEFVRVCVSDQKPEEKGLFLERKDLCIWRSLGQETWQVCIFGIPARGHIQTKGFPALIYFIVPLSADSLLRCFLRKE